MSEPTERIWSHKLLVLSDLHITTGNARIIGLDPLARTRAVLDHALSRQPDADALVLLGDLGHHGDIDAYRALRTALSGIAIPILPLLGNHDRREAFRAVFADAPSGPGDFVQSVMDLPGWRIVTLDTLDGPPYDARRHGGRLCADRLAWLDARLDEADGRRVLVFAHHPPFPVGLPGMDVIRLADGPDLTRRLARHGGVHLVCGHLHLNVSGSTGGVPWTILKSPCHQAPLDLVTADSALSVEDGAGYAVALLTADGPVIHAVEALTPDHPAQRDLASA